MQTEQNNNWVGMPLKMGDRVQSNLLFQPLMKVKPDLIALAADSWVCAIPVHAIVNTMQRIVFLMN
ncbi:MAG TPA: hypothetical protein VKK81_29320 [Candidatus Binatia bacterium]|nr:hypothetical protein [Candidatus Binatia bacterium]